MASLTSLVAEAKTAAIILNKEAALEASVEQLTADLARLWKRQSRAFIRLLSQYKGRLSRQGLESLAYRIAAEAADPISEGEWVELWEDVEKLTEAAFATALVNGMGAALQAGGDAETLALGVAFDLASQPAQDFLAEKGGLLITRVNKTTKDQIRVTLGKSWEEKWSWGRLGKELESRFADMTTPLGPVAKHIRTRGELIAITELGNAFEEGSMQTAQTLESAGVMIEKKWLTSGDARVSAGCRENSAADWLALNGLFPSGHTRPLRFPGCRCSLEKRVAGGQRASADPGGGA